MDYVTVKWIHIMSSTLLFGTGLGSAFYMFFTNLTRDPRAIAIVVRRVVWADNLFTAPTAIIQPLSGWYLAHLAGFPFGSTWLAWSIGLYVLAGACWLPVVWIQVVMARIAREAAAAGAPLPDRYWRLHATWVALGIPAFIAFVAIFWLMVAKPA